MATTVETAQVAADVRTEAYGVAGRVPRRFTADEFERMGELGILDEDERIELIDGEIIEMAAVNLKHVNCVARLTQLLSRAAIEFIVHVQNPVRLNNRRQPQPDLYIVRDRKYTAMPTPADVLLLIEVSDSSFAYDRGDKMVMYANAGIVEYWVADVNGHVVERFAEPRNGVYERHHIYREGDTLTSLAVPEIAVVVADIWE